MIAHDRQPLAAHTAQHLLDRVRAGEWPLGAKLPGETTLAAQLGVGRSTVREAIRELAGRGVLQSRQGAGVFLTALDAAEDWDEVLRRASISAVIEARIAIEAEAAAHAARRRTPADLRAIRRALAGRRPPETPAAPGAIAAHVDADTAFHRAIIAAAHNDVLTELFDAFVPRLRAAMIDMLRLRPTPHADPDQDAHAALLDAVLARDPERAAAASRAHLGALLAAFGEPAVPHRPAEPRASSAAR